MNSATAHGVPNISASPPPDATDFSTQLFQVPPYENQIEKFIHLKITFGREENKNGRGNGRLFLFQSFCYCFGCSKKLPHFSYVPAVLQDETA
jgi:hypothetical protein